MKVILIKNMNDYDALRFEENFRVTPELCKRIENGEELLDSDGVGFDVSVHEFPDVDREFLKFIRTHIQDDDDSKHTNFYVVRQ